MLHPAQGWNVGQLGSILDSGVDWSFQAVVVVT